MKNGINHCKQSVEIRKIIPMHFAAATDAAKIIDHRSISLEILRAKVLRLSNMSVTCGIFTYLAPKIIRMKRAREDRKIELHEKRKEPHGSLRKSKLTEFLSSRSKVS